MIPLAAVHSAAGSLPPRRRGRDQHFARAGARLAHVVLRRAHALAAAGRHRAPDPVAPDVLVGRGELGAHLGPVAVELLGDELRERRIGALPHLGAGDANDDAVVGMDDDPGVDFGGSRAAGRRGGDREREFEREAAGERRGNLEELATGDSDRHGLLLRPSSPRERRNFRRAHGSPFSPGRRCRSGTGWSWPRRCPRRSASDASRAARQPP